MDCVCQGRKSAPRKATVVEAEGHQSCRGNLTREQEVHYFEQTFFEAPCQELAKVTKWNTKNKEEKVVYKSS
jgi:hypothetical protein